MLLQSCLPSDRHSTARSAFHLVLNLVETANKLDPTYSSSYWDRKFWKFSDNLKPDLHLFDVLYFNRAKVQFCTPLRYRRKRSITQCIIYICTGYRWMIRFVLRSFYPQEKILCSYLTGNRWAPEPKWALQRTEKSIAFAGNRKAIRNVRVMERSAVSFGIQVTKSLRFVVIPRRSVRP